MIRLRGIITLALLFAAPALRAESGELSPSADESPLPAIIPLATAQASDTVAVREMQVHFLIATEHYKEGRYREAINEWMEVLKIQPNHVLAREKIQKAREKLASSGN